MNAAEKPYRTLFIGELVQESFLSLGGTDDPLTSVDSPFCRDGAGRPVLRGTSLAGALVATLRRALGDADNKKKKVKEWISGSEKGKHPSVWLFFNSHSKERAWGYRQHVAINAKTGAAEEKMLFNVETLPPGTSWSFLLEVVSHTYFDAAELAQQALLHWTKGRCLLGREVARGMGWMRLQNLERYNLTTAHIDHWPNAEKSEDYTAYIRETFKDCRQKIDSENRLPLPGWQEYALTLCAGERDEGYGIDSLSIGGYASEELTLTWDATSFLAPDGMAQTAVQGTFDPDFAVVTLLQNGKCVPYIPGSSLRGPLRHALQRQFKAKASGEDKDATALVIEAKNNENRKKDTALVQSLFGSVDESAKLLIQDALFVAGEQLQYAWLQQHAEDEFAGSVYGSGKFDRMAVMQGKFSCRIVLEDVAKEEKEAFEAMLKLASTGQIGIGGGQWRGHGWLKWEWQRIEYNTSQEEKNHA